MADPISTIATGLLNLIGSQVAKTAAEFGKAKIKEYLNGTPVDRAIKATSANFPYVGSVESSLKNFVLSERFTAMLEEQMDGRRVIADEEMADSLVREFGFFTSLSRSHEDALQVLRRFLENLRDELYRSPDAPVYAARTEELHHREVMEELRELRAIIVQGQSSSGAAFQSVSYAGEASEYASLLSKEIKEKLDLIHEGGVVARMPNPCLEPFVIQQS